MDRRVKRKRRFRNSSKKFYVSQKHVPLSTSTSTADSQLSMKPAAVSDGDPNPFASVATTPCSENWRELSKQLGIQFTRKRDVSATTTSQALRGTKSTSRKRLRSRHIRDETAHITMDTLLTSERESKETIRLPHRTLEEVKSEIKPNTTCTGLSAGRCVSLDCEMVGTGPSGKSSMLARCSVVNHHGNTLYDKFVAPMEKVTDYRTRVSGVRPQDLIEAPTFSVVQKEVSDFLKGKILVGHSVQYDLKALLLSHPTKDIRDTANYKPFKDLAGGRKPSLKRLAKELLGMDIQEQAHNSVEDAQVTMRLYQLHKRNWELYLKTKYRKKRTNVQTFV